MATNEAAYHCKQKNSFNSIFFCFNFVATLIIEVFPGTQKIERKEKPQKKLCRNPVEYAQKVVQEVWTCHTGQTGCVTGFSSSRHSRARTVCISAGQNMQCPSYQEEIGLQPRSKVVASHAQQDFDTISSEVFLLPFFACQEKPLLSWYYIAFKYTEKPSSVESYLFISICFMYFRKKEKENN